MTATDIRLIISDMRLDVRRPTTSVLLLLDFAAQRGITADTVLRDSGWSPTALTAPGAEISAGAELQCITNAVAALGNPQGLGLEMGVRYHLTSYGIWGFALISAPTLRSAFETGLRYLDLTFSYLDMRIESLGEEVHLVLDAAKVPAALQRFMVERDAAAITTIQSEIFAGALLPRRIELAFPAPAEPAPYLRLFGLQPQFASAQNRVIFDAAVLDRPLPQANPQAAQLCEAQCRQLLMQRQARSGFAAQVRDALLRNVGGRLPDLESVAESLHLTSRTLRRRLDAEGTSFRALLDEVRQTLAEELLGTTGMKVAEVASRLGYSEPASFLHARKRWRTAPRN